VSAIPPPRHSAPKVYHAAEWEVKRAVDFDRAIVFRADERPVWTATVLRTEDKSFRCRYYLSPDRRLQIRSRTNAVHKFQSIAETLQREPGQVWRHAAPRRGLGGEFAEQDDELEPMPGAAADQPNVRLTGNGIEQKIFVRRVRVQARLRVCHLSGETHKTSRRVVGHLRLIRLVRRAAHTARVCFFAGMVRGQLDAFDATIGRKAVGVRIGVDPDGQTVSFKVALYPRQGLQINDLLARDAQGQAQGSA
jgi:hypothetical protein